ELDLVAEHDGLTATLATQFLHDMAQSREIVLMARRRLPLPPKLVDTVAVQQPHAGLPRESPPPLPVPHHKRSLRERKAVVTVTLMRVAGGARRMLAGIAAAFFLVARTVAGGRAAFGVLVDRYAGQARRVARAVLGDPDDADDAAQDGFLSALVKLGQYDAHRPFGPWLMRIVANAATDRRRRRNV